MAELLSVTGSFATEGEKRAAEVLKQLPDSWLVICNKTLPTRNGHSHEMDFVVVGKCWVFLLDEKSWRGKIRGNDELWIRADGSSERSPLANVDYVAKVLAGHLIPMCVLMDTFEWQETHENAEQRYLLERTLV